MRPIFELILCLLLITVYPMFILYAALTFCGIYSWAVIAVMVSPVAAVWYKVVKERISIWREFLLGKPFKWNLEQTIDEYVELMKKQKSKD